MIKLKSIQVIPKQIGLSGKKEKYGHIRMTNIRKKGGEESVEFYRIWKNPGLQSYSDVKLVKFRESKNRKKYS